jgi:hypothetical protein
MYSSTCKCLATINAIGIIPPMVTFKGKEYGFEFPDDFTKLFYVVTILSGVYAVQLYTQYSYIIDFIHKLVCSTMFRTS